jgi:hypothetical protein
MCHNKGHANIVTNKGVSCYFTYRQATAVHGEGVVNESCRMCNEGRADVHGEALSGNASFINEVLVDELFYLAWP